MCERKPWQKFLKDFSTIMKDYATYIVVLLCQFRPSNMMGSHFCFLCITCPHKQSSDLSKLSIEVTNDRH
uniref:Uncharacterized protein n=1 Tax=Arundo donax TaxID=35708 RepID=A0A0A8YD28_ARUDO